MWCFAGSQSKATDPLLGKEEDEEGEDPQWRGGVFAKSTVELSPRGDWIRVKEMSLFVPVTSVASIRVRKERMPNGDPIPGLVYLEVIIKNPSTMMAATGQRRKMDAQTWDIISDSMPYAQAREFISRLTGFQISDEQGVSGPAMS